MPNTNTTNTKHNRSTQKNKVNIQVQTDTFTIPTATMGDEDKAAAYPASIQIVNNYRLEKYSGGKNLIDWITEYKSMADINKWSDDERVLRLHQFLSGTAKKWHQLNILDKEQSKRPDTLDKVFDEMKSLLSANHSDWQRDQMEDRKQQPNESVQDYYYDKRILCRNVEPKMDDSEVIKKVMDGMLSYIKADLEKDKPSTCDQLLEQANAIERGEKIRLSATKPAYELEKVTTMLANLSNKFDKINAPLATLEYPPVALGIPQIAQRPAIQLPASYGPIAPLTYAQVASTPIQPNIQQLQQVQPQQQQQPNYQQQYP